MTYDLATCDAKARDVAFLQRASVRAHAALMIGAWGWFAPAGVASAVLKPLLGARFIQVRVTRRRS